MNMVSLEELSEKGKAALEYTRIGWYVIPLCWPDANGKCGCFKNHDEKKAGKAPLLDAGWDEVRLNEEQVIEIWTKWPEANVGVLLEPSGLIDVETDTPDGEQEIKDSGIDNIPHIEFTSGNGVHRVFRAVPGMKHLERRRAIKQGKSRGIDILGDGYSVFPPSVHRSGRKYDFTRNESCGIVPAQVMKMLLGNTVRDNGTEVEVKIPDAIPDVDLNKLKLPEHVKELARLGIYGVSDGKYQSRSEAQFAFIRYMLKYGYDIGTIAGILLDDRYAIGEKVRERRNPLEFIESEIRRALQSTDSDMANSVTNDELEDEDEEARIYRLDEFDPISPPWMIDGILQTGFNILSGLSGSGKSLFVRQLATCVATGQEFLGHTTLCKPTKVLYMVDPLEGNGQDIKKHFIDLNAPADMIYIFQGILDAEQLNGWVAESISEKGIGLVILDTVGRFITLDSRSMLPEYNCVVGALRKLRPFFKAAGTVLGLTHTSKSREAAISPAISAIGTTAWGASANSRLLLCQVAEQNRYLYHKLSITHRGAESIPETILRFDYPKYYLDDSALQEQRQEFKEELDKIRSLLPDENEGYITSEELANQLNVSAITIRRRMAYLLENGEAVSIRGKGYQKNRIHLKNN